MADSDAKKRRERKRKRQVIADWKEAAQAIKDKDDDQAIVDAMGKRQKKKLRREARREALAIMEDAARTQEDFEKVLVVWDKLEWNEAERIADHEQVRTKTLTNWQLPEESTVVPPPINHAWWRQLLRGRFIDLIYDCPHEIHELTSSHAEYSLTEDLDENRKEILCYWAIRQWPPQPIAAMRKQSDRNIRKVYNKMIDEIRYELFYFLYWRYKKYLPLGTTQWAFVIAGIEKYDDKPEAQWELNDEDMIYGDDDMRYELFYYLYWRHRKRLPIKAKHREFMLAGIEKYKDRLSAENIQLAELGV